ncbi:nucleotide-sugar transporter [Eremomyces bilateralis CBS 781.70]|uniref:Nucleotide-sugar transporter n=1 Tax=Eremomyces bilateralis CBS 781.70 TaxID=1392243 RepID=A0A6G1G2A9_9PEZI|nr:nucleotide-sugar transporter [Eremomyces bilateralis CBS 781.70]KAF1812247.1 nucleotide-sugar transporter [Eremomyces bilateralis CBS 781.70]
MVESSRKATMGGVPLKYISLVTLTVQNSALILIMRYSRVMPLVDGKRYSASTAVFLNEVIKLTLSLAMVAYETSNSASVTSTPFSFTHTFFSSLSTGDSWKLAIPAVLYTVQNTLQYVAVSNLDAATFQVTYQLKILTTALFSVIMLRRSLSIRKWISLVLLMVGVAIVQMPVPENMVPQKHARGGIEQSEHAQGSATIGLVAVMIACAISGLAGVYFEKVLKESNKNASLWVRNVQLSFYSLFPAFIFGVILKEGREIQRDGFFAGYNWVVWLAITFQALGGLIVALVVNYADNIAKNFATSLSIVISFVASVYFFGLTITINYVIGTAVVLYATYLYSSPDRRPSSNPIIEEEEGRNHEESTTLFNSDHRSQSSMDGSSSEYEKESRRDTSGSPERIPLRASNEYDQRDKRES